jgi:hypothetical protein
MIYYYLRRDRNYLRSAASHVNGNDLFSRTRFDFPNRQRFRPRNSSRSPCTVRNNYN